MARNGRADRPPSCPVLGVFLPRQPVIVEAVVEPQRHFCTVNCRIAKGSFAWMLANLPQEGTTC